MHLITALQELAPGKEWTLHGGAVGGANIVQGTRIVWHGSRSGRPTLTSLRARVAELEAAQPLADLREERNKILAQSDWIVVRAAETGVPVPAGWASYRQALRDIPASYSSLAAAVWPVPPAD